MRHIKFFFVITILILIVGCSKSWTQEEKKDLNLQILLYSAGLVPNKMSGQTFKEFNICVYKYVLKRYSPKDYLNDKAAAIAKGIGFCKNQKKFQKYFPLSSIINKINKALQYNQ